MGDQRLVSPPAGDLAGAAVAGANVDQRVIAIDGPAGAGKSTVARALAARLGMRYLDTGAMYRAVAFAALRRGIDPGDDQAVASMVRSVEIDVSDSAVVVDGVDATVEIRGREVTSAVSAVAANAAVRAELRDRQRAWARTHGGGVIEGRDIGSVVFPGAVLKLYLTASPRVRAERRVGEVGGDVTEMETSIAARDRLDLARADGPLRTTPDAHVVDTTGLSIDEVVTAVEGLLARRGGHGVASTPALDEPAAPRGPRRAERWFYSGARALVVGFTVALTRLRVVGKEHVPATGAYIVAPVHRSNVDTPLVAAITRRRLRFMGKDTMWKLRWFGRIITALGAFPVTRHTTDREAMRRCIDVLRSGEPLVLFPEGERKSGPLVQPLYDGAAYVALKADVPIVPVGIAGSERVMPKGAKWLAPRRCVIVVGPPLLPRGERGQVRRSAVKDLTEALHAELQRLYDEASARL